MNIGYSSCCVSCFQDIETGYGQFKAHNESKNIFKAARTPGVIVVVIILFYVISAIFNLVGLYMFVNAANTVIGVAILTLATWAYIRSVHARD